MHCEHRSSARLELAIASILFAAATAAQAQTSGTSTGATDRAANAQPATEGPAQAQQNKDAQDSSLQEVVVTGIRGSLERAIEIKRNSSGVVDAISAEDIGKFPDTNL